MRTVCRYGLCAIAFVALAACVSPEEQRAKDNSTCGGYGFAPGSEGFANCMMQTSMARDEADRQRDAQFWANENANRRERERLAALKKMNLGY